MYKRQSYAWDGGLSAVREAALAAGGSKEPANLEVRQAVVTAVIQDGPGEGFWFSDASGGLVSRDLPGPAIVAGDVVTFLVTGVSNTAGTPTVRTTEGLSILARRVPVKAIDGNAEAPLDFDVHGLARSVRRRLGALRRAAEPVGRRRGAGRAGSELAHDRVTRTQQRHAPAS